MLILINSVKEFNKTVQPFLIKILNKRSSEETLIKDINRNLQNNLFSIERVEAREEWISVIVTAIPYYTSGARQGSD